MCSLNGVNASRGFRRVFTAFCLLSPVFCLLPAPAWALQSCAQSGTFWIDNRPFNSGRVAYHSYDRYLGEPINERDGHVFVYDLGTGIQQPIKISTGLKNAMNPHFSPDGRYVTFMAIPGNKAREYDQFRVYVYDCVKQQQLSGPFPLREPGENDVTAEDPKFSPDGARIVFKGNSRIWTMTRDGRNARELTNQSADERSGPNYEPTNGSRIVYWKEVCPQGDIYWAFSDMTGESCLVGKDDACTVKHAGDCLYDYYPIFWDSDRILFTSWNDEEDCDCHDQTTNPDDDLFVFRVSTGTAEPLSTINTNSDESDPFPVDSSWIGFSSTRDEGFGGYDLYLTNLLTGVNNLGGRVNDGLDQLGGCYSTVPQAYVHNIPESVVMAGQVIGDDGVGSSGREVSFTGLNSVLTDDAGYYARLVPAGWSGTVGVNLEAPETANASLRQLAEDSGQLTFGTRVYNHVGGDLSGEDFVGWVQDASAPVVTASSIEIVPDYAASTAEAQLSGGATDAEEVVSVEWSREVNGQTANGTCTFADGNWSAVVPLLPGKNLITISAEDAAANVGIHEVVADFNPCLDEDRDGVCVQQDLCPNTIAGLAVDETGCPAPVTGDFDRDGDVDSGDFEAFESCASGPGIPLALDCGTSDFDGDTDVDQVDFSIFQRCFSGEGIAADPNCSQ